jgi:hypothetical protein
VLWESSIRFDSSLVVDYDGGTGEAASCATSESLAITRDYPFVPIYLFCERHLETKLR